MRRLLVCLLPAFLVAGGADQMVRAEELVAPADRGTDNGVSSPTPEVELVLAVAAEKAWVELVPLVPGGGTARVDFPEGSRRAVVDRLDAPGAHLLCAGAERRATTCRKVWLEAGSSLEVEMEEPVLLSAVYVAGTEPVAGAKIRLVPAGIESPGELSLPLFREGDRLIREIVTDRDGQMEIPKIASGDYLLEARLPGGRLHHSERFHVPTALELKGPGSRADETPCFDLGEMSVPLGMAVEVFVADASGIPVPAARVGLSQGTGPTDWHVFEGQTDAEGKAMLEGLEPDQAGQATCIADGYVTVEQSFEVIPPLVECFLDRQAEIVGRVLSDDEEGLEGALVQIKELQRQTVGDEDGEFRLNHLNPGTYSLVAVKSGYSVKQIEASLEPGESREVEIVLAPASKLRGLVEDALDARPIPGAEITLPDFAGTGRVLTSEEGEWTLDVSSSEPLRVRAKASGYAARTVEASSERLNSEEPLVIALSPGGRIRVSVWDEQSDGPCQGCVLSLDPSGEQLRTDAQGQALSEPLEPGLYTVQAPRITNRGSVVTLEGGVNVKTARVAEGQITEVFFGERSTEVEIAFDSPLPGGWVLVSQGSMIHRHRQGVDGRFLIRRKPGEFTELFLEESGAGIGRKVRAGVLAPDDERQRVDLPLPTASVSGTVLRGDEPLGRLPLELVDVTNSRVYAWGRTNPGGDFLFPYLQAGVYALRLEDGTVRMIQVSQGESLSIRVEQPATP